MSNLAHHLTDSLHEDDIDISGINFTVEKIQELEDVLCSNKTPLAKRFRSLFTLKAINNYQSINSIIKALDTCDSDLLNHELAYCLGQMKNELAIDCLTQILETTSHAVMTRHEAAEALGAIGSERSLELLEKHTKPEFENEVTVRETCELAYAKILFEKENDMSEINKENVLYSSVDPAPPLKNITDVKALGETLMNVKLSLFDRYRAMFTLRNIGTEEAVLELANGFNDKSALFRHEIAYVFGQMQHVASVPSLIKTLEKEDESDMVRHEAAEALGSIATEDCLKVLTKFQSDHKQVVKESAQVGLDMLEYYNSDQFQYAEV
ncbi:hypothetical protein HDU92_003831 [Lobulomyces angularis]|nr:hypothetical protein HDU92_003831 [Lobulomyces angularis]